MRNVNCVSSVRFVTKCLPLALVAIFPLNASASWGAWDAKESIRGVAFQQRLQSAAEQGEVASLAGVGSDKRDTASVANYVTSSLFSAGDKMYRVQSVSRLTRTPIDDHLIRYEMQPLIADFKGVKSEQFAFAYPMGARKMVVDRDPGTELLSGGNLPDYMIESGNKAVLGSEKPSTIEKFTSAKWKQSIELNLKALGDGVAKSDPTQFTVSRMRDGSLLLDYAVKKIDYEVKDGHVTLSARGFAVVDTDFNVVYVSGLAYDGELVSVDGVSSPIRGRKLVNAQNVGFDSASVAGLPQRIKDDFADLSADAGAATADTHDRLNEIYAEIDPAMAMWDADSQAIAEHRSNIALLVAFAAWSAVDSAVTLGVNAVGLVSGDDKLASWNGPTAAFVSNMTTGLTSYAGGDNASTYMGKTNAEWAGTVTSVAMSVVSITGGSRMLASAVGSAGHEAMLLLKADQAATNPIFAEASRMAVSTIDRIASVKMPIQGEFAGVHFAEKTVYEAAVNGNTLRSTVNDAVDLWNYKAPGSTSRETSFAAFDQRSLSVGIADLTVLPTIIPPFSNAGVQSSSNWSGASNFPNILTDGSALTTSMPRIGSATYTGSITGLDLATFVSGVINLSVNFQSTSLTGNLTYTSGLATMYGSANITGVVSGNGFFGTSNGIGHTGLPGSVVGAATSGTVLGRFYGQIANEIAGGVTLHGVNDFMILGFAAHK